ncbi:MAG: protein kinase [Acidobacteria bacterium]|nr:protein kinase [Acidobacteriota bacterium]
MSAAFSTGQHIGDYEIISILGAGGMGKVYKVRNVISERTEAMKILLPDLTSNQSLADRFLREIRLLATLHHPNIAALRTALTYENQLVMIIEYVEGETIANRIARAPLSTAEVVNYSDQCLAALSYAHKQNIIHRDIKPANMMLTPEGIVKLMDFGIARSNKDGTLTSTGTTLGSLNYMPPEQVRGEAADARSDIYSFGASLYEMLTGKLPFDTDSQYALMTAQLNSDPPPPITLRSDLPPALNQIILMCMAKDPDKRFQSADALRSALKTVPVSTLPPAKTTAVPSNAPSPTPASATGAPMPAHSSATTLVDTPLAPSVGPPIPVPAQLRPSTPTPTPQPTHTEPPPVVVAPPVALPPRPSATHRGLWLALGSLVGVCVLLAAGIYIPRRMGTHAEPSIESPSAPSAPSTPPSSADASKPASSSGPAAGSDSPLSIQAPGVGISVDDKGNVAVKSPMGSVNATADGNVDIKSPHGSISATKDGSASIKGGNASINVAGHNASAAATRAPSQTATRQPPSAAATVPPPTSGPSADEIQRLTDDGEKLSVRADTVTEGINTLKQQQAATGLGLRADMVSAQQRMGLFLKKGNDALQHGDTTNAQKYFDQADAEISKLEKFLGH